jgi:hypothetical protein
VNDSWILEADYRLECYNDEWTVYMVYAVVMIFVYPLGVPFAFWFILYRHEDALHIDIDAAQKRCDQAELRLTQRSSLWTELDAATPELLQQIRTANTEVLPYNGCAPN